MYANGSRYVGQWEHNKKVGHGTFTFEDGSVYDGPFVDDRMAEGKVPGVGPDEFHGTGKGPRGDVQPGPVDPGDEGGVDGRGVERLEGEEATKCGAQGLQFEAFPCRPCRQFPQKVDGETRRRAS